MVTHEQPLGLAVSGDDTKRCRGEGADSEPTFDALPCTLDATQACCVVAQIAPVIQRNLTMHAGATEQASQQWGQVRATVARTLDCSLCHCTATAALPRLTGLRLGAQERRILLLAPPLAAEPAILEPAGQGRAARESHLRAIRSLRRAGLVQVRWPTETRRGTVRDPWRRVTVCHVVVRLSLLGEVVVARVRRHLEQDRPIRWAHHLDAIGAALGDTSPTVLTDVADSLMSDGRLGALMAMQSPAFRFSLSPEQRQMSLEQLIEEVAAVSLPRRLAALLRACVAAMTSTETAQAVGESSP